MAASHSIQADPKNKSKPKIKSEAQTRLSIELRALERVGQAELVNVFGCYLNKLAAARNFLPRTSEAITAFHTLSYPEISLPDYLARIANYTRLSNETLIQALIQIQTLAEGGEKELIDGYLVQPGSSPHPRIKRGQVLPFLVDAYNLHRLLLTTILVVQKFNQDEFYNNAYFGIVGGVQLKELNLLEVEFLSLINFDLYISPARLLEKYAELTGSANHQSCLHAPVPPLLIIPEEPQLSPDVYSEANATSETEQLKELEESKELQEPEESKGSSPVPMRLNIVNSSQKFFNANNPAAAFPAPVTAAAATLSAAEVNAGSSPWTSHSIQHNNLFSPNRKRKETKFEEDIDRRTVSPIRQVNEDSLHCDPSTRFL